MVFHLILTTLIVFSSLPAIVSGQQCSTPFFRALSVTGNAGNCGVDPNDGSNYGVTYQYCFNTPGVQSGALELRVVRTRADGQISTLGGVRAAITSAATTQTVALPLGIRNLDAQGSFMGPVTVYAEGPDVQRPGLLAGFTYTPSPVSSISPGTTTEAVTVYFELTTTTTTTPSTTITTTDPPQATVSTPCVTGTTTRTVDEGKTTTTTTVTPAPTTSVVEVCTTVTVTRPGYYRRGISDRSDLSPRQATLPNTGQLRQVFCPAQQGQPQPQSLSTVQTTTYIPTATTIITEEAPTTTIRTTVLPTPATVTVCSNFEITVTTFRPTKTITSTVTRGQQQTITVTSTRTITKTVGGKYPQTTTRPAYTTTRGY